MSLKEDKMYTTHDISVAAYLLMSGLQIVNVQFKSGRYVFDFLDPNDNSESLALKFLSSDCARYDSCMRLLRSMLNNKKSSK